MNKSMPVVKSQKELQMDGDGNLVQKKRHEDSMVDEDEGGATLATDDNEQMEESLRLLQEQFEKESKKANIPVPPIVTIDDYDHYVAKDFTRPVQYQKHKTWSEKEMDELLEYEMDDEDLDWLSNKLPELKNVLIKEDKFEQIVDRLEKESFKQGKMCDQSALEPYKLGGGKQVTAVYEYWSRKRSKLGKALIRRMQPPTPLSDPSPHNTFRPREKEEKKARRTRKNDKDAHKKLKALQTDLKRAKEILERVHWREKIKKAILKVEFCLQFAKDIKDIPPSVISENDQFCKEVAREKAKREAAKKRDLGIELEPHRPRAAPRPQMPTVIGTLDGAVVAEEQPAVSEERAEAIRRCFQHLMSTWEEDRECAGTSALPVTLEGKMCTENSCHSGEKLPFRGRARLGRGGRVVYDRCSAAVSGMHGAFSESGGVYGAGANRGDGMDEYMMDRPGDRAGAMWKSMRAWDRDQNVGNGSKDSRRCDWKKRSLTQISSMWGMADGPYIHGAASACSSTHAAKNNVDSSMRRETAGFMKRARSDRGGWRYTEPEMALSEASTRFDA